ncbi:MAG: hypothetical protein M0D57_20430 [Sphingobacteriales bacterium JAD_PAG50586_3]|nr:MAG: hypothetical protein M0D57_20430 [Sphingobacteriales bacterium JAD_PAG50586_3]
MKKLLGFAIIALFLFACKKENDVQNNKAILTAMPLSVGNYWIYEKFSIDSNDVETLVDTDSLYIQDSVVIDGETYFRIMGGDYSTFDQSAMRDSAGCLVSTSGIIWFSQDNYTDTLAQGSYTNTGWNTHDYNWYLYMVDKNKPVTVPAGTFTKTGTSLINFKFLYPDEYPYGAERNSFLIFADNVGMIKRRSFDLYSSGYIESRLVRYHIN